PGPGLRLRPHTDPLPLRPGESPVSPAGRRSPRRDTELEVQATVVGKMLEQAGFKVKRQMLDAETFNKKTFLPELDQPMEAQAWDLALLTYEDAYWFPAHELYHFFALNGPYNWGVEEPELQQLHKQVLGTVDRERQRALIQQMERHTRDNAY